MKIVRILRNNWKKSVLAGTLLAYGINRGVELYNVDTLMTAYCEEAVKYGDLPVYLGERHRKITVILNPAANKRKAKKNFEKYCAPLLYLSGAFVSIIETEKEGHARQLADKIDPDSDAVIVAGGDGTLSEALTGLMRQRGELCTIPVGVLPLGKTNTLAKKLYGAAEDNEISLMAKATMAIIKGNTKPIDAVRVELIDSRSEQKPVYGVAGIEWGTWHDVRKQRDKLWYFGPARNYASLVFPGHALEKKIIAKVRYTLPCSGCSLCYSQRPDLIDNKVSKPMNLKTRWWSRFTMPIESSKPEERKVDYRQVENKNCNMVKEKDILSADIRLTTTNVQGTTTSRVPRLLLSLGPEERFQGQLLTDGLKFMKEENAPFVDQLEVKQIEIRPVVDPSTVKSSATTATAKENPTSEECLSIDSEEYEVRPIRVTVLPNSVNVFCT